MFGLFEANNNFTIYYLKIVPVNYKKCMMIFLECELYIRIIFT